MESISLFGIVAKGGILIVPIFICSVIVVAVAVERALAHKKLTTNRAKFMMSIRHPLMNGDILSAINECTVARGSIAAVVRAGLEKAQYGRERMKEAMEAAGNTQTYLLEKHLSILATLAGITPLIGFLGTVTGMIKAFMKIQQLSGNVNADVLAGGIWEAMVTTAAGLAVGIPAMILYNYFVHRVREFIFQMEEAAEEVLDLTGETSESPVQQKPAAPSPQPHTPSSPPSAPTPQPPMPDTPPRDSGRIQLAETESFDPGDKNFDGGLQS